MAEVSFAFSRQGDSASEQANERAWGEQKMGRTEEGGGGFVSQIIACNTVTFF